MELSLLSIIAFGAACVGLGLLVYRPVVLPYLLVFILGLEYFGAASIFGPLTVSRVGIVGLFMVHILAGSYRLRVRKRGVFAALFVLAGYMMLTILWTTDFGRTATRVVSLVLLLATVSLIVSSVNERKDLNHYFNAIIAFAIANGLFMLYQFVAGFNLITDNTGTRAGGLVINPSEGAFYLSIAFIIVFVRFLSSSRKSPPSIRMGQVVILLFLVICIVLTGSRGSMVALSVGFAWYVLFVSGNSVGKRIRSTALIASLGIFVFMVPSVAEVTVNRFSVARDDNLGNRLIIWESMLESFQESPVIGLGLNSTNLRSSRDRTFKTYSTHNTVFTIMLDGGLLGLMLFLFVLFRIVRHLRKLIREELDPQRHHLMLTWCFLFTGILMLSHDLAYNKLLWLLLALLEAAAFLTLREFRVAQSAPPSPPKAPSQPQVGPLPIFDQPTGALAT